MRFATIELAWGSTLETDDAGCAATMLFGLPLVAALGAASETPLDVSGIMLEADASGDVMVDTQWVNVYVREGHRPINQPMGYPHRPMTPPDKLTDVRICHTSN